MDWNKRDCPIFIRLLPGGAGWEDVIIDIHGNHHEYSVSGCLGDGFGGMVASLYALYPNQNYRGREEGFLVEEGDLCKPSQAKFIWDEEGQIVEWTLTYQSESQLEIHVEEKDDCSHELIATHDYTVSYSDMCYAIGKALTEAMKVHGFTGFYESVWESDINVRQLCFLKACGLGQPDFFKPKSGPNSDNDVTSFKDEVELLLFDM